MSAPYAVLGQGSIGRRHAEILVGLGVPVRIWDPAGVAQAPNGAVACATEEEALHGAVGAVVASPTSEHVGQAIRALETGCHVLVEKPLALTEAEAERVVDAARSAECGLYVAMNLRHHPGPRAVRDAVMAGAIGEPLVAEVSFGSWLPGWRPDTDYRFSYSARAELGGGVLLDVVHEVDYSLWALGPVREVGALLAHVSQLEMDVEDVALMHLSFESGAVASVVLDYLDHSYRRGCRIVGSEGSVVWRWEDECVRVLRKGREVEERAAPSDVAPSYRRQAEAFVGAVETGGSDVLVEGSAALHTHAVLDAARRASEEKRVIALAARK